LFNGIAVLDFFAFDISRRRHLQRLAPQPEAEIRADSWRLAGQIAAGPRFQRVACTALAAALVAGSIAARRWPRTRSWDIGIRFFGPPAIRGTCMTHVNGLRLAPPQRSDK
jgi:hypothetical protein